MLHIVNKSPFTHNTLDECARFVLKGAPIILIEDAVLAARAGTSYSSKLSKIMESNPVFVLAPDLEARGVKDVVEGVEKTGYAGFVGLVEDHKATTWL